MGGFVDKMEEGVVRCLPQRTHFTFVCFYVYSNFGENPSRNASVRVHADEHTDRGKLVL